MKNLLPIEKQEKIIADLLLLKKELDGRKQSILANPIAVFLGNPFGVLKEAFDEFSEKYTQFKYKATIYLAELGLSEQEMRELLVPKGNKLRASFC